MTELLQLLAVLESAGNTSSLTLQALFRFVTYAAHLKDDILLVQAAKHPPSVAPDLLPNSVRTFLSIICNLSPEMTDIWWSILNDAIWNGKEFAHLGKTDEALFISHGSLHGLSMYLLFMLRVH
jgi:hypothetical protein